MADLKDPTKLKAAEQFLNAVLPDLRTGECYRCEVFPRPTRQRRRFGSRKMLATHAVSEGQSANAYFALATFPANGPDRKAASALRVAVIWSDLDCGPDKPHPDKESAWRAIDVFPLPPHVIVDSGRGLHAYWLLAEPIEGEELARVVSLVRGLAQVLDSDSSVADRARIMRVPGTMNLDSAEKKKDGKDYPVELLKCDTSEDRYRLEDFVDAGVPALEKSPGLSVQDPGPELERVRRAEMLKTIEREDPQLLRLLRSVRENAPELWNLLTTPGGAAYENDPNRQDLAVMSRLRRSGLDRKQVERVFHISPLGEDARRRKTRHYADYVRRTVTKAFQGVNDPTDGKTLPMIVVNRRPMREVTKEAWAAIKQWNQPPTLFLRGNRIQRLTRSADGARLQDLDRPRARHLLDRVANWLKWIKQSLREASPPAMHIVDDLLADPNPPLPELNAVANAPFFGRDGQLVDRAGYDATTKIYLDLPASLQDLSIPERPSTADVAEAVAVIDDLLRDFDLVGDADRAYTFAMALDPFVRPSFDDITPLYVVTATVRGSGKGLLIDAVTIPATGQPRPRNPWPGAEIELDKTIRSMLLGGQPHAHFDNLEGKLDSAVLAAALTASIYSGRPLYANEVVHLPQRLNWALSGNNVEIGGDLGRRIVPIRLAPNVERPELRTHFAHPELIRWAQAHRRELVTGLLTIAQAWFAAGMPPGETLGSYEAWSRTIGGILDIAGIPGFLDHEEALTEADVDAAGWRRFLALWEDTFGTGPVTSGQLLAMAEERDVVPVNLWGASPHANRTIWGRALGKQRGRIFGGFKIVSVGEDTKTHVARFRLEGVAEPAAVPDGGGEFEVGQEAAERCTVCGVPVEYADLFGDSRCDEHDDVEETDRITIDFTGIEALQGDGNQPLDIGYADVIQEGW